LNKVFRGVNKGSRSGGDIAYPDLPAQLQEGDE
jgi:hypothetical protein